jgi:two-component system OmpR family response regulator
MIERVLVVDDDADIRAIVRIALESIAGWRVGFATNGADAVASARRERPDVILLDVMMPDQDGPTTLAQLKSDPETRAIPVLFVTAKVRREEVNALLSLGARGVIGKPFDPIELPSEILRALEGAVPSSGVSSGVRA